MKGWQREKMILERLQERGEVTLTEICALTEASVATVRRDFETLQKRGTAARTRGGLCLPETKAERNIFNGTAVLDAIDAEKQRVAVEAAAQVRAGESVFIGAGKTCNFLAKELRGIDRLTVVTTSISAVMELSDCPGISLTLLGGDVHTGKNYVETLDPELSHTLRNYFFDKAFFTVEGVDLERGYTVQDKSRTGLYMQLSRITRRLYMLLDSRKFDHRAFATVFPIEKQCRVVTTQNAPEKYVRFYAKQGIPCTVLPIE